MMIGLALEIRTHRYVERISNARKHKVSPLVPVGNLQEFVIGRVLVKDLLPTVVLAELRAYCCRTRLRKFDE